MIGWTESIHMIGWTESIHMIGWIESIRTIGWIESIHNFPHDCLNISDPYLNWLNNHY